MRTRGAQCTNLKCKVARCVEPRPKTCPPGCLKQKVIQKIPMKEYIDIHAAPPPGDCLDCTRNEKEKYAYRKYPPGTKPIPPKPLGGAPDKYGTETFLDTFDCQEQPWRSSSQRVETNHSHSYQDLFRPSVHPGQMTCNNLGDTATCEPEPEWKSSKAYLPCAHEYGKPWQWRSCVRYLGEGHCKEKDWKPSIHSSASREGDLEKPYRSQIVVKKDSDTHKTTEEGPFRSILKYIPEYVPPRPDWRPSRAHVCTQKCYHNSPKFEHIYQSVPAHETTQRLPPRNLRQGNSLFVKQHPLRSQLHSMPPHDDPPDFIHHSTEEGQLIPQTGKKPILWTAKSNPTYADGKDKTRRRIISSGHIDHLNSSCLCICKKKDTYRPTIKIIDGAQYHPVSQRNVIVGPLAPGNEKLPRFRNIGPAPMAPQGHFNEDIIDGRFHRYKVPKEPLSEHRAQYTTHKPWLRQEIYNEVNQAYKENRCHDALVHPSMTKYLYEDRCAVVT